MLIIPAIDILNGECVRLFKGDYGRAVSYQRDPAVVALKFAASGVKRIHIVDLDAARGQGSNRDAIRRVRKAVSCTIEAGGGIRTEDDILELLDIGVDRLILGTVLVRDPDVVAGWVSKYGRHFIGGIDALDGEVKVAGWEEGSGMKDSDLAKRARDIGVSSIIYTSISRDGTLEGPDIANTVRIADEGGLPVILSGGISCNEDFKAVKNTVHPGIVGIITGKAYYEGKVDLEKAVAEYQCVSSRQDF
ncbi:MAG: 1-(5-phosphoribosyl)-5-[(5-phosphoribosylamino)methylideneamino]imidazole-4-carboxamide isomerase [Spirochaetales bacterium]|nr:1-(5-phosphoribosyl)-5-[(5-phosphoribosylamino)methylideneamino]imidazole-4-carboxamide isomerase [Spirochaetales bacterium]